METDRPIEAYTQAPPLDAKARAHAHAGHIEYVAGVLWTLFILWIVIAVKLAPRLQRFASRARRRVVQTLLFTAPFVLALGILMVPVEIWAQATERRFGLSIQGWGSFARDWAVGQLIAVVLGTVLVYIVYSFMRRKRWWLWAWVAMLPVLLFVVFVEPFVIEPLFFKFSPLTSRDPALAQKLQQIAAKAGEAIPLDRMFVMQASEKLRAVNAYVTGLGASKRVVVWDTTLSAMKPREIAFVFGHELGHYVLGHVVIGLIAGALGLLAALFVASRVIPHLLKGARIDEFASLPVLLLVVTILSTLSSPISSAVSREIEHRADAFGLEAIGGVVDDPPQAAAHAFQRLGEIDLAEVNPNPLAVFWLYDHPPIRDRVRFVLTSTAGGGRSAGSEASPPPPPR
jgi:Zn-dependent protease with chaperone function